MKRQERIKEVEWQCWPDTYVQWAEYGVAWLAEVFQEMPYSKTRVTAGQPHEKNIPIDHTYTRLRSAQKEVAKPKARSHDVPSYVLQRRMKSPSLAMPSDCVLGKGGMCLIEPSMTILTLPRCKPCPNGKRV